MTLLTGIPASPGVAVGPARILERISLNIPEVKQETQDSETEMARFHRAVEISVAEMKAIREEAKKKLQKGVAEVFTAHLLMLEDPVLLDGVSARVRDSGLTVESALAATVRDLAGQFEKLEDAYFRERAADVRDIGTRILTNLKHVDGEQRTTAPGVLVTEELLPSDALTLDAARVVGIATEKGGVTSHASIIARSLGIPCVVGVTGLLENVQENDELALDGSTGEVYIHPDEKTKRRLESLAGQIKRRKETALKKKDEPAITKDGRRIMVLANAASLADMEKAIANGAEGIGLFRTEFLFLDRKEMPTEEEQAAAYRAVAEAAAGKPVAIRLLDIGGDKPAQYLKIPREMNPFLGLRAVRLLLERPAVLRTQLRAILRAAQAGNVSILVPMVTDICELNAIKEHAISCRTELEQEGIMLPQVSIGAMIEVPAAALCAERLAQAADYFSIGTNDLTQYCMAVDRGNAAVANLYQPAHAAVLSLIDNTVKAAHAMGIKVGVCGEAAADEKIVPLLVRLGVDSLSVSPAAVPEVKEYIRALNMH